MKTSRGKFAIYTAIVAVLLVYLSRLTKTPDQHAIAPAQPAIASNQPVAATGQPANLQGPYTISSNMAALANPDSILHNPSGEIGITPLEGHRVKQMVMAVGTDLSSSGSDARFYQGDYRLETLYMLATLSYTVQIFDRREASNSPDQLEWDDRKENACMELLTVSVQTRTFAGWSATDDRKGRLVCLNVGNDAPISDVRTAYQSYEKMADRQIAFDN